MEQWKKQLIEGNSFNDILGQDPAKRQLSSALLTSRHVIIVGPPGIGKTTMAKNVAKLLPPLTVNDCGFNCDTDKPACPICSKAKEENRKMKTKKITGDERFVRVQGSPDLSVEDLFGEIDPVKALKVGPTSLEAFTPGKIFRANNGILFFDELNRAPEKTQNALLQVLEENTVTIGSYTVDIPANFIFIGTMNPEESTAAEKLSSVLMDRFDVVTMTYPDETIEYQIVTSRGHKLAVEFSKDLLSHVLKFIRMLRDNKNLVRKPSVRASLGLYERAQANAVLGKRKAVSIQDINEALISVLAHRIELKPALKYTQSPEAFIAQTFKAYTQENPEVSQDEGGLL